MPTGVPFTLLCCSISVVVLPVFVHYVQPLCLQRAKEEAASAGTGVRVNCELLGGAGSSGRMASALSQ